MNIKTLLFIISILLIGCNTKNKKEQAESRKTTTIENTTSFEVRPISHATMILEWDGTVIYIDPAGGKAAFNEEKAPNIILVTDIHGDHMNVETITAIATNNTIIIAPDAVAKNFSESLLENTFALPNGKIADTPEGFVIEAIPMYNLREEALKFHPKGRGNGYVISKDGKRVYISGDTEDIPEMRALQDIDVAFVCMNLPYTMTVDSAANAVIEFAPKTVYPYHYRGTDGLSNVPKFKELVNTENPKIEVIQLDWYK